MLVNTHERGYDVPAPAVAALLATLGSDDDRLWPGDCWPRMRFERGLVPGAIGGHGPVRYRVESVDPAGEVVFRFTGPAGFHGGHAFTVVPTAAGTTVLRHELRLRPRGWARLTWPFFFRPLHDALLEEALDKGAAELGCPTPTPYRRGAWVRLLRRVARLR